MILYTFVFLLQCFITFTSIFEVFSFCLEIFFSDGNKFQIRQHLNLQWISLFNEHVEYPTNETNKISERSDISFGFLFVGKLINRLPSSSLFLGKEENYVFISGKLAQQAHLLSDFYPEANLKQQKHTSSSTFIS